MKALFISLLLISSQAFAKTAFETLREAFDKASTPATVLDFEDGQWKRCVFSDIRAPHRTQPTRVRTLQYRSSPGQGPLFPGDEGLRIDVFNDHSLDYNLPAFFQASVIEEDGVNFRQVLNGPPWRRMNIYGRTEDNMLLFYVEVSPHYGYHAPMHPQVYGYCWNDSEKHEDPVDPIPDEDERPPQEERPPQDEQPLPVPAPQ